MAPRNRKTRNKTASGSKNVEVSTSSKSSNYLQTILKYFVLIAIVISCYYYYLSRTNYDPSDNGSNSYNAFKKSQSTAKENKREEKQRVKTDDSKALFQASLHPGIVMKNITVDGRKMQVQELKPSHSEGESSVRIYQVDDFLSKHECDGISTAHVKHVLQANKIGPLLCFSGIVSFRKYLQEAKLSYKVSERDFVSGTSCVNETFSEALREKFRWSFSTAFYPGESKFSLLYENRLRELAGLLQSHGGKFQVTSYPISIGYKSHTDCTVVGSELRDRFATALVYLQDVPKGGETIFTRLKITVRPKQGRLIVWNNMNSQGECDPTSVHEAARVIEGRKYILQRWYYFQNFRTLGIRPREPEVPARKPGQPRVSCDLFEEGSCRWYDEWGFHHLNDYNRNEKNLV